MSITLTNEDLQQIDKLLQELPFKHAYPIFQFLRSKVEQEYQRQSSKPAEAASEIN